MIVTANCLSARDGTDRWQKVSSALLQQSTIMIKKKKGKKAFVGRAGSASGLTSICGSCSVVF